MTALTEIELAARFAERHAGEFLYVPSTGLQRWYRRDDAGSWQPDATQHVARAIQLLCLDVIADRQKAGASEAELWLLGGATTVLGIEKLARAWMLGARTDVGLPATPTRRGKAVAR
jgi:hypothetical protein